MLEEIIGDVLHETAMAQAQEPVASPAKKRSSRRKGERGCRLPEDFEPDYDFAIGKGLFPERVKIEIEKFRDYWSAKTGKDATKHDWSATWRNWVRKTVEDLARGNNYGKGTGYQTGQQRGWGGTVSLNTCAISNILTVRTGFSLRMT
ncbi:hypothetical protein V4P56_02685 [Bartonella sp. B35(2025)]